MNEELEALRDKIIQHRDIVLSCEDDDEDDEDWVQGFNAGIESFSEGILRMLDSLTAPNSK